MLCYICLHFFYKDTPKDSGRFKQKVGLYCTILLKCGRGEKLSYARGYIDRAEVCTVTARARAPASVHYSFSPACSMVWFGLLLSCDASHS